MGHDARHIAELVMGGVTCFSDMYGNTHEILRAADEMGIRALIGSAVIDVDGGGERRLKEAEERSSRRSRDYRRIGAAIGPHAEYTVGPDLFVKDP